MFSLLGLFHEGRIVCPDRSHCTRPQCVFSHLADLPSPKLDIPVESPAPASPLSGRRVQSDASSIPAKRASSPLRRASEPSSSADEPPRKLLRVGSAQKHLAVPTASSSSASGPVLRVGAMHSQVPIPVRQVTDCCLEYASTHFFPDNVEESLRPLQCLIPGNTLKKSQSGIGARSQTGRRSLQAIE